MSKASVRKVQKHMLIQFLKSDPVLRPLLSYTEGETDSDIIITSQWSSDLSRSLFHFQNDSPDWPKTEDRKCSQHMSDLTALPQIPIVVSSPLTGLNF